MSERSDIENRNANEIMRWLSSFKRGDELRVGKHLFWVENARGISIYITKGKRTKLYKLHTVSLDPPLVEVREVWGGSGDLKEGVKPLAALNPLQP